MSQSMESNTIIKVTYLIGHLVFKEPEWKMKIINPNGLFGFLKNTKCILYSDYCSIQGELTTVAKAAHQAGIRFKIEE